MGLGLVYGLWIVGGALSLIGLIRLTRTYPRLVKSARSQNVDRRAATVTRLEVAYTAAREGLIVGAGLTLTYLGLALLARVPFWMVFVGVIVSASCAFNALLFRYLLGRLSSPHSG